MHVVGGILLFSLYVGLFLFQAVAFFEGLDVWFGLGRAASILAFVAVFFTGQLGTLAMIVIAVYGMIYGWGWPWWQAIALACPFLVIGFLVAGVQGITGVVVGALRR